MDVLKELESELLDLSILGLDNLDNNYRFDILRKRFNELRAYSVVLEKISDYINELYSADKLGKSEIYLKLTNFNNALLTYISDYNRKFDVMIGLETYNMPYNFNLSLESLNHTKSLLESTYVTGKWASLYEIHNTKGFLDNRLIGTVLDQLYTSYNYIEWEDQHTKRIDFSIADIVSNFGVPIIAGLKERYFVELTNENRQAIKNNIIKSIYKISKSELENFINELLSCNFNLEEKKQRGKEANLIFTTIINLDEGEGFLEAFLEQISIEEYKKIANKVFLKRKREREKHLLYINSLNKGDV